MEKLSKSISKTITKENTISFTLGKPHFGWLPLIFEWNDFRLEIEVSDVPIDPIEQMLDCLIGLNKGINNSTSILWNLEPFCYYFTIEKTNSEYSVRIQSSKDFVSLNSNNKKLEIEFKGNYSQTILPIYRELKKYVSYSYTEPHWSSIDISRINILAKLVKMNKNK